MHKRGQARATSLFLIDLLLNFFRSDVDQQEHNGTQRRHDANNGNNAVAFQRVLKINYSGVVGYQGYSQNKQYYGNFFAHVVMQMGLPVQVAGG